MKVDDIKNLKIDQQVLVVSKKLSVSYFPATIKSINDWTKRVGVVDTHDKYEEYPPRLILIYDK